MAHGAVSYRLARAVGLGLSLLLAASPALAGLKIRPVFIGGIPPADNCIAGGGDFQEIFKVAAEAWERVFNVGGGHWDVTIEFGWGRGFPSLYGKQTLISQGGNNPVRITRSEVQFNNNLPTVGPHCWFADPTPRDSTEYGKFSSYLLDDVPLNRARIFSEATGAAEDRIDLLTIATHEIGHALGLDDTYAGFRQRCSSFCFLEITAPRPYAGGGFGIQLSATGPHIQDGFYSPLGDSEPLMVQAPRPGERQLISVMDALVIAEISSFDKPNLVGLLPPPW